jgi:hypothetical protein
MAFIEGQVISGGSLAAGAQATFAPAWDRSMATTPAHGRYALAAKQGNVYTASMQAGASLGTALTATAVTLTLYNPLGSNVLLSLLEVTIGVTTVSGGAGTSIYVLAGNTTATAAPPATTTAGVVRNCKLGGTAAGTGLVYTAATLPAAPVILRTCGSAYWGTAVGYNAITLIDDVGGSILLGPNTAVTLQGIGQATSGVVSFTWEEIPA